jgi:hypothetical protein
MTVQFGWSAWQSIYLIGMVCPAISVAAGERE